MSLGKAAKLAGQGYEAFVEHLASIGVSVVDYSPEELDAEVAAIG
jgi:predicted HTH domain antitoxin